MPRTDDQGDMGHEFVSASASQVNDNGGARHAHETGDKHAKKHDARQESDGVSSTSGAPGPNDPIAIVLAGAGARGAYEAGFIATLLPRLRRTRPTIFVGTSAGAINAALLAATAHLPPEKAGDEIMKSWSRLRKDRVWKPLWRSVPLAAAQYLGAIAFGTKAPDSFADTAPLKKSINAADLLDWKAIRQNIQSGTVSALAVVATETGSGRSKVFYQTRPGFTPIHKKLVRAAKDTESRVEVEHTDDTQAIDYVKLDELNGDHVRASAAIPVLFPPVKIELDGRTRYFIDGGVRLNAPLKPAIKLGAKALVVVSTDPRHFESSLAVEAKQPTIQGQLLQVARAVFADRMIEDIRVLLSRNRKAQSTPDKADDDKIIPVIFGGPLDQDRLGSIAARAVAELLRGAPCIRFFRNVDVALLNLITSVSGTSGPDLISYILFEPMFLQLALRAGIQDASAMLNDYPSDRDLWQALAERDRRHQLLREEGAQITPVTGRTAA